jgi:uncharacterized protein
MTGRFRGRVAIEGSGDLLLQRLFIADTWWTRLCGLQFRKELPPGCGLLLSPCAGIHTCCMRFPIDVLFLRHDGVVLDGLTRVRPWRLATTRQPGVIAVLEVPAGTVQCLSGERLLVEDIRGGWLPITRG